MSKHAGGIHCPLCNGVPTKLENISTHHINSLYFRLYGVEYAIKSSTLEYYQCSECDLGFFNPMEAGNEQLYEKLQTFDWYYMADKWEYGVAKEYVTDGIAILEVGAGMAAFGEMLKDSQYTGLEFNDKAINKAAEKGIRLIKQPIEQHADESRMYDLIASFQVLEHVEQPRTFINSCVKCLKREGTLIIGVPAHDGLFGYAINNILDMPPHHVTHWSEKTLKKVGELFGLDVVKVCYEPIARYHQSAARTIIWENRLRSLIGIRHRLLDTRLSSRGIHKLSSVLGRIIKPNLTDQLGHTVVVIFRKMND